MESHEIVKKINNAFLSLLEPLTPEDTYKKIIAEAIKLVKGQEGKISLMHGRKLYGVYSSEKDADMTVRENGNTYRCFRTRKAFVVRDGITKTRHLKEFEKGFVSGIFIPLYFKRSSLGVLLIKSKKDQEFTKKELEVLKLFGSIASLTIRKTELLNSAQKNLEIKDQFIALAAHELRTPLTSMSGYIQLLHRNMSKKRYQEVEWTDSLLQESNRLKNLIEEILDINKLNAGKLKYTFEEVDLEEIIHSALDKLKQTYVQNEVDFKTTSHVHKIVGDKDKFMKAIYNILENAAKFSPQGQKIKIRLKNTKSHSIILIQDMGPGIHSKDLPYIFEGFFKSKGNEKEGMGLGLFFTKRIVEGHKGIIKVQSEEGKGTIVEIKLPVFQIEK